MTIGGGNAVAVRYISCESCELDPFWSAASRFLLAGVVFAMISVGVHTGMPRGRALLALTLIFDEAYAFPHEGSTWGAQAFLVVGGSVGVFWLYVFVLQRWTASAASYQLVLIPLVTVVLSAWLQDEQITWTFGAGSIFVLIGVYLGALRRPPVQQEVS